MTATVGDVRAGPAGPAAPASRRVSRRVAAAARAYPVACGLAATAFVAVAAAFLISVLAQSWQAFSHDGIAFVWSGTWNPAANRFGCGLLIAGTVVTTGCAMLLAVPIGIGIALFLHEMGPKRSGGIMAAGVEFLAAVPSIVVGLWALLVLSPVFARDVEPALGKLPVLDRAFSGPAYGPGILLASVVLAVMVLPTVVTLTRSALAGVDRADREAALALGATRWQVARTAVLPGARRGIAAAVTLAVGRALGESIAVAMVIGNRPSVPHSLLAPGATIGSAMVNQFAEASPGLQTSSIIALAFVLLALTALVNAGGVALLGRADRGSDHPVPGPPVGTGPAGTGPAGTGPAGTGPAGTGPAGTGPAGTGPAGTGPFGAGLAEHSAGAVPASAGSPVVPGGPVVPAGAGAARTLGRRRVVSAAMTGLFALCTLAGLVPLVALLYFTVAKGAHALSLGFLTHAPTPAGIPGGGISTAITGTARVVGLALLMAVPVGLLTAFFLYDRRGRVASAVRFTADVLTGIPSIVVGIFAYALLVVPLHHPSSTAAAFALAVLMVPIMIRANEEAFRAVPVDLWEAGVALGAGRGGVARRVIAREALAPVVSANLLATARGVGETAPLLFTVAAPSAAMTLWIFDQGTQAFPSAQQTAWATALVLLAFVLLLSAAARLAAWRLTRHRR